ncbi:MAG TPA: glycine zipper family protein [Thermoanaerobaculia bacterium]|nr:glycine zipper family protein [Thermoanaerobaculia bacterium]
MANDRKVKVAELERTDTEDMNRDPITGEPGSHPVGTTIGAAGAGAAGAAVGAAFGGPVGALVGGAIGAIAGGAGGHAVAEQLDPTGEDDYWAKNYTTRDYVEAEEPYDVYRPAYEQGWTARRNQPDRSWDEVEPELARSWAGGANKTGLGWDRAGLAAHDAWNRADESLSAWFAEEDDYWRSAFDSRNYVGNGESYDQYRPAYRYGWMSRVSRPDGRWEDAEDSLQQGWRPMEERAELKWERAKHAVRDAWNRVESKLPGDFDRDGR